VRKNTEKCRKRGGLHFLGHGHLIEKSCANSYLGRLVFQLLNILEEEEFKKLRPRFIAAARPFGRKQKAEKAQAGAFICLISSKPFPHGQWIQIPYGVNRCDMGFYFPHDETLHMYL
jgi:hypothetical protein